MLSRTLLVAITFLIPVCAAAQEDTGPAPDVKEIHYLIERYTKAVDTVDLNLLSQIWSHSPEVSFIYPLGRRARLRRHRATYLQERHGWHVLGTRS